MTVPPITGDIQLQPDGSVEGWVWSPDLPGQRLVAEILVEDVRVGAMVSAMFRRNLVTQGVGDGHHGFRFRLPPGAIPDDGPVMITGRERQSKQVFARIVRQGPAPAHREAIDAAAGRVQALWTDLEALRAGREQTSKADHLRDGFARLALLLAARARAHDDSAGIAATVALGGLQRAAAGLALPRSGRPGISIVLPAGPDVYAALRRLRALAPALTAIEGEILLIDDAADPATALLPALVPNIVYFRAGGPEGMARGVALGARAARGTTIALLEPAVQLPSAAALLALARHAAAAPQTVLLGPAALAACARVNALAAAPEVVAPARLGLRIALARDLLVRAGGVEAEMADGAALKSADLWLRCRLLGAAAQAWREPVRTAGQEPPQRERPRAALLALAAFRHRWRASGGGIG